MQIRLRLTLQFILIAAGILLASFFYIHFQFRQNLEDEFYDNLRSKAFIIGEMVAGKTTDDPSFKEIPFEPGQLSDHYAENISIYTLDGTRIYTLNPTPENIKPATLSEISEKGECKFDNDDKEAIGILFKNRDGESYIVIAESMIDTVHIENLKKILIWVFIISIAL